MRLDESPMRVYNGTMNGTRYAQTHTGRLPPCTATERILATLVLTALALTGCTDGGTSDIFGSTTAWSRFAPVPLIGAPVPEQDFYLENQSVSFSVTPGSTAGQTLYWRVSAYETFPTDNYDGFTALAGNAVSIAYEAGTGRYRRPLAFAAQREHNNSPVTGGTGITFVLPGDILSARHFTDLVGISGIALSMNGEDTIIWLAGSRDETGNPGILSRLTIPENPWEPSTVFEVPLDLGEPLSAFTPLALSTDGTLYIADSGNNRILSIDTTTVMSPPPTPVPVGMMVAPDETFEGLALSGPRGIAISSGGILSISDSGNNRILAIDTATPGNILYPAVLLAGTETVAGQGLSGPAGLALSGNGVLYIADSGNARIVRVPADPQSVETPAVFASIPVNDGETASPRALAFGEGTTAAILYIADSGLHRVFSANTEGTEPPVLETLAGSEHLADANGDFFGGDREPAIDATLDEPLALAINGRGEVHIADSRNARIRYILTTRE